jgi:hypothetical protein
MIRNIGALLVKGVPPRDIFTQHMAKYTSPTLGKDGTSHFGDLKVRHIVSPISMLGDLIPVMTGVAMAGRYLGQNIVALTWIGDGGSSTGAFHEGLNLAAQQGAPFVLIVENNQWAYSTPVSRQVPIKNLADRAVAYGIRSWIVDGNDVVAVYNTAKEAVEKYLTENKIWDAKTKSEIDARIARELDVEQKFAEESPMPPPELAEEGVYCEGCHPIEASWQRPKAEVTPPACSLEPGWEVKDYGAFLEVEAIRKEIAAPAVNAPAGNAGGNGAKISKPIVKSGGKPPQQKPPLRPIEPEAPEVPRVPFGRGPKDKSVRESQNPRDRHANQNPRDKRGRR